MRTLTTEDLAALVELLTDRADPELLELLRQQLRGMDDDTLQKLQAQSAAAPDHVAMEIDQAVQDRVWSHLATELKDLRRRHRVELLDLLILLCRFGHSAVSGPEIRQQVARLHVLCDCRLATTDAPLSRATELADFLGREMSFHGNQEAYHSPENCFIDTVIAGRRGNPISLSALYLILGERLGVPFRGISLRDYFIVGVYESPQDTEALLYIDPFRRGQILSRLDCIELVEQQGADFAEEMLVPVHTDLIFRRLLDTLYDTYERAGDTLRCDVVQQFIELWDGAGTRDADI